MKRMHDKSYFVLAGMNSLNGARLLSMNPYVINENNESVEVVILQLEQLNNHDTFIVELVNKEDYKKEKNV